MTTIEVTIVADDDKEFVINILDALAQKQLIEFDQIESFPVEGPELSNADLIARVNKSERSKRYTYEEAKAKLGL